MRRILGVAFRAVLAVAFLFGLTVAAYGTDFTGSGTQTITGDQTYEVVELDTGTDTTFSGGITANEVSINGNAKATFSGTLNVTSGSGYMEIMDGAANTTFNGNVTAGSLAIDTIRRSAGSSTNTFKSTLALNGQDPDITGRAVSLVVGDGTNLFTGAVTTGNKDAIFAKSTSTFNTSLNASSGTVDIGYSDFVKNVESEPGKGNGFYRQNATVILGNSARITAANVNVFEKGILKVNGDATVTGNLNFKAGSTFAIDAADTLTVSGATDIETGAMANIQDARGTESIGNIVLSSAGGISGGEFAANGLYTVAKDGNNLKITGINPNGAGGAFGDAGIIPSGNSGAVWGWSIQLYTALSRRRATSKGN